MIFFAWIVVFAGFVHTQTLNPRSVNVALETVLEFDGKHNSRDVKAIDKLQRYLSRIKQILTNNEHSRRNLARGLTFSDFLRAALQTVAAYEDSDLLDAVAVVNNELRKYHYKGCRFHELVENQSMRRDMAERLGNLNDLTAQELRAKLTKAADALDADDMSEQKKKMLDYIDSVYVGDDIKSKMDVLLTQLDHFRRRSKRSNLNLSKVINQGLRSIVFDYYTNLNVNARKELKARLETIWHEFKKSVNVKEVVRKAPKSSASVNDYQTTNPKKMLRFKTIKKKAKRKLTPREPRLKKDVKKVKRQERKKKEKPKRLLRKKTDRLKKYKSKDKRHAVKPTRAPVMVVTRLRNDDDRGQSDFEKSRMRSINIRKRQRKGQRQRQRQYETTQPILQLYLKNSRRSHDFNEDSDEGLDIQSSEKHQFDNSLKKSFTDFSIEETVGSTVDTTVAPNVLNRIDKIEKVLSEIKSLVSQSQRKSANEIVAEKSDKSEPTTNIKSTESTVSTTPATKISLYTESTTQKIPTEGSKIINEEFKSKTQETKPSTATESDEEDTDFITEAMTKSTDSGTMPKRGTESTFATQVTTPKQPELESTVTTTLALDLMSNDTRRSNYRNEKDRMPDDNIPDVSSLDLDKLKTPSSNYTFKKLMNDRLKSIKEHDLAEADRERKYDKHNIDNLKDFDNNKVLTEKDHEFSDVQRSIKDGGEKDIDLDEFISGKVNLGKETELLDEAGHSKHDLKDFTKEKLKGSRLPDIDHHSKGNFNEFIKDKIGLGAANGLTDLEHGLKEEYGDLGEDKISVGKEKLSNLGGVHANISRRSLKSEEKDGGEIEKPDIGQMLNETRRAHIDNIIDKNSEGGRKIHEKVREKIAGHMRNLMDLKENGKASTKFDFNIDDPFDLKADI